MPYAHWVFTLPHALNPLAIRHPRWLYGALFDSAAATLLELAANPRWLSAVPGFSLVLHTWSQDLSMHLHVHALITCGGLDAEGRWRAPARGTHFLFPIQAASKVFRGKFLARLDAAHRSGELPDDPQAAPGAWQVRRRGLLACGHKRARLAAARAALQTPAPDRGRLRRWSRAARRDRLLVDPQILWRAIRCG